MEVRFRHNLLVVRKNMVYTKWLSPVASLYLFWVFQPCGNCKYAAADKPEISMGI